MEYFDEKPDYSIKGINTLLDKYKEQQSIEKRGGLNEKTDLRQQIASLIQKPIGQVYGLTKGWSASQMYQTLKAAQSFTKNPPACFWVIWKQKKDIYGKGINKKGLSKVGKKGRPKSEDTRTGLLF